MTLTHPSTSLNEWSAILLILFQHIIVHCAAISLEYMCQAKNNP